MSRKRVILGTILVFVVVCQADEKVEKPPQPPLTRKAQEVIAKHDATVRKLKLEYAKRLAEADLQLVKDLDILLRVAATEGDAAEIERLAKYKSSTQSIYEARKREASLEVRPALREVILSRRLWAYRVDSQPERLLTFNGDGSVLLDGRTDFGQWGIVRDGAEEYVTMSGSSGVLKLTLNPDGRFTGKLGNMSMILQIPKK